MNTMLFRVVGCLVCIGMLTCSASGDEPKPKFEPAVLVGYEVFPANGLERIGADSDPKHGLVQFSKIEAFFLYQRGKVQTANWPPKRKPIVSGEPFTVRYAVERADADYSLNITAKFADDVRSAQLTFESPKGSSFDLKEKIEISVPDGTVIYLPAQTLLNGKNVLYLALWIELSEEK